MPDGVPRMLGMANSSSVRVNTRIAADRMPGMHSGSTTWRAVRQTPAPAISEAFLQPRIHLVHHGLHGKEDEWAHVDAHDKDEPGHRVDVDDRMRGAELTRDDVDDARARRRQ